MKDVNKYRKLNPEVNRKAVEKYRKTNPEVNREAAKKYASNSPHVNQAATANYNEKRLQIRFLPWTNKSCLLYTSLVIFLKNK